MEILLVHCLEGKYLSPLFYVVWDRILERCLSLSRWDIYYHHLQIVCVLAPIRKAWPLFSANDLDNRMRRSKGVFSLNYFIYFLRKLPVGLFVHARTRVSSSVHDSLLDFRSRDTEMVSKWLGNTWKKTPRTSWKRPVLGKSCGCLVKFLFLEYMS